MQAQGIYNLLLGTLASPSTHKLQHFLFGLHTLKRLQQMAHLPTMGGDGKETRNASLQHQNVVHQTNSIFNETDVHHILPMPDTVGTHDGITRRDSMSCQNRWQISLALFLVVGGVVLIAIPYTFYIGIAILCLGIFTFISALCVVGKASHVTVPGHFLLHARTGTCYTPRQALAVQRRLDRIRRCKKENHNAVQTPLSLDANHLSLSGTPPPCQMEPPPSYETVMKTTTAINQL